MQGPKNAESREKEISAYIGYVPLHSSTMGRKLGYKPEDLPLTEDISSRIVRLPFYTELPKNGLDYCLEAMAHVLTTIYGT
jgi:dTDP-4-amino-4,6-dideoxygalactose transaminase